MNRKATQAFLIVTALLVTLSAFTIKNAKADDGNYYNFDYEDFWKEFLEVGYPAGSRLPCNGTSEANCTWAWEPWYKHGTDLPRYWVEQYSGRTVSGYAQMFQPYSSSSKNLHGGIYRQESVQPCHKYRFTMWSRAGLDENHPTPTNSRMYVGISPTGKTPGEIVLTDSDINQIVWSQPSNSRYAYENLAVEATAQGDTVTVYTRANPDPENDIYIFWDEGSFTEIPHTADLVDPNALPASTGSSFIYNVYAQTSTNSATIGWDTGSRSMLGQILYRRLPSAPEPSTYTYTLYLPLIQGGGYQQGWQTTNIQSWNNSHQVQLTGLAPDTTYEYVIVSYGYVDGSCQTLASNTTTPRRFTTP